MFIDENLEKYYGAQRKKVDKLIKEDVNLYRVTKYVKYRDNAAIEEKTVLYETFHGKSMTDNPFALFLDLLDRDVNQEFLHVWTVNADSNIQIERFSNLPNVKFVKVYSDEYLYYLACAKYLINNTSFPPYYQKREGQIYVNTWHGTPLKTLGKDMQGAMGQHKNLQRNFMQSDYVLSPNSFTTKKLIESHDIEGIYKGKVIEEGYPRIDLITKTNSQKYRDEILSKTVSLTDDKIILYAPTWRGEVGSVGDTTAEVINNIKQMMVGIPKGYQLLLKVHSLMYNYIKDDEEVKAICVPDYLDTCELLSVVDCLITDYSSIFFDFYVKNKPVFLFMYDKESYLDGRGMYIDLDTLSPLISESITELISQLQEIPENVNYSEVYEYTSLQKGNSGEKVWSAILDSNRDLNIVEYKNNKKNILFYLDDYLNGELVSYKISIINSINFDEYNVIVLNKGNFSVEEELVLKKIDPRAKLFFRVGQTNISADEWPILVYLEKHFQHQETNDIGHKIFTRELDRMIGNCSIDYIINLSTSNVYWTLLLYYYTKNVKTKSIFVSDKNLKQIFAGNKKGISSIVDEYDRKFSFNPLIRKLSLEDTSYEYFDNRRKVVKPEQQLIEANIGGRVFKSLGVEQHGTNPIRESILLDAELFDKPLILVDTKGMKQEKATIEFSQLEGLVLSLYDEPVVVLIFGSHKISSSDENKIQYVTIDNPKVQEGLVSFIPFADVLISYADVVDDPLAKKKVELLKEDSVAIFKDKYQLIKNQYAENIIGIENGLSDGILKIVQMRAGRLLNHSPWENEKKVISEFFNTLNLPLKVSKNQLPSISEGDDFEHIFLYGGEK